MGHINWKIREASHNAFYRDTVIYIVIIVTLILGFMLYHNFLRNDTPDHDKCKTSISYWSS
jgi:hypothetical protein